MKEKGESYGTNKSSVNISITLEQMMLNYRRLTLCEWSHSLYLSSLMAPTYLFFHKVHEVAAQNGTKSAVVIEGVHI